MKPLILVASPEEQRLAEKYLPEYTIVYMGIGASNVIRTLCELPKDTPVVNIGFAGSSDLPIGSVNIVSTTWRLKDESFVFDDYHHGYELSPFGIPCYTSNSFVTSTNLSGGVLFDMELNYIAAFPVRLLGAIKIVSDNLCLETYKHVITRDEASVWYDVRRCLNMLLTADATR